MTQKNTFIAYRHKNSGIMLMELWLPGSYSKIIKELEANELVTEVSGPFDAENWDDAKRIANERLGVPAEDDDPLADAPFKMDGYTL